MDEIRDRVKAIRALPEFSAPDCWLTFYLTASQERLERIVPHLRLLGGVNFDDAAGGFSFRSFPCTPSQAPSPL